MTIISFPIKTKEEGRAILKRENNKGFENVQWTTTFISFEDDPQPTQKRQLTKKQIEDEQFEKYKKDNNIEEIL